VGQNQLQKPLAWFRYAATKSVAATSPGFDTPPQKAWRLLNQRSLQWPEQQLRRQPETRFSSKIVRKQAKQAKT